MEKSNIIKGTIQKNIPNILTFIALFFDCLGILLIFKGFYLLSFVFIIIALIFDILDGTAARYLNIDSSLGRQLDGFVDVMTYILYPAISFYFIFSIRSFTGLMCVFIFISAGIFRLARFNTQGFLESDNKKFYIGMPVFYNLLIPIILFFWQIYYGKNIIIMADILLLLSSFSMVQKWPFYKPNKKALTFIILSLIILIIIIIYGYYSI